MFKNLVQILLTVLLVLVFLSPAQAGWMDDLNSIKDQVIKKTEPAKKTDPPKEEDKQPTVAGAIAGLTQGQMKNGLKEELFTAINIAVSSLGKQNGFLGNNQVRIPVPDKLRQVEKVLRQMGQGKLVDQFVESMNRAAEKAVPGTTKIFSEAIQSMTISDAADILQGQDNAATEYFKDNTREALYKNIRPIVTDATESARVTQYYKAMMKQASSRIPFLSTVNPDLDGFVTDKALDGLFFVMAVEEKKIRKDPAARTTEILKDVFGKITGK